MLRIEPGAMLRAKFGALDSATAGLTLQLWVGERLTPLVAISGSALSADRCLTVEVSLPGGAMTEPGSLEVALNPPAAATAELPGAGEPTAADCAPAHAVASVALCELLNGRPDQMARLAARSHYRWRSDNERGHFSAVCRDAFYAPQTGAQSDGGPSRAEPQIALVPAPDPARLRADLLKRLTFEVGCSGATGQSFTVQRLRGAGSF